MPSNGEGVPGVVMKLQFGAAPAGSRASVAAVQIEALLTTLEVATEPSERAEILVDVARRLRDDLGDAGQAIVALLEAWKSDPTVESILDELEPLATAEGRWAEVLEATRALAAAEPAPARAIAYAEALVRWLLGAVPDLELARQWLERIRALDPTHWQLHMLQAAVSREHGDTKRELDELDLAVLSARRADDRARIHLLMAARFVDDKERSFNLPSARKHFDAAHRLLPRSMEPLRGLEQIAVREGDKNALADVLGRQADADLDDEGRTRVLVRLASLEEEDFRRPELAAKTLERVLALSPGHGAALEALERTYGASRAWPELAVVLEQAAASAAEPNVRVARLERLSEVLESKLGDVQAAIAAYQRLAERLPDDETVLSELARLSERVGDVHQAVRQRDRLAELAAVPAVRARMNVLAAQLLGPVDAAAARQRFERAVTADPSNQAAWTALLTAARADFDWPRVERYLEERAYKTEVPRARAAAFVELAEVRHKRGDAAAARRAYEEAASSDATNEQAALALVLTFVEERRYAEAEPLCEVAAAAAERDKDLERLLAFRLAQARVATALGKPDRALSVTLAAYLLRPDALEVREALVAAAVPLRAEAAIASAREALIGLADQPDGLSVEARTRLADVLSMTGDTDRAAVLYDDVLTEAPAHESALSGMALHHTASGNAVAALHLKLQLAQGMADPDARFAELSAVAAQFAAEEGEEERAASIYEEARRLRPGDLPTLHRLLGLYPRLGRWAPLFDVLRSIAEVDGDPARRSKTLFTMAQLAKEELADRGGALALFEQVLDVDPSQLAAFENIVRILTEDRDWLGLEQMYRRMIGRTGEGADVGLKHALHKQIGIVYRDRLSDPQRAIEAYQVAVRLRPDDEEGQVILRELLARTGQAHGAVTVTLERVLRAPLEPLPYPALLELLLGQGAHDRALCVASAMSLLGILHPGAQALRASLPPAPLEAIPAGLRPDGYRDLLHQDLDPALTEVFEVVAPLHADLLLARVPARDRAAYPGQELTAENYLAGAVARASAVLGAPSPRVFLRPGQGPALVVALTRPASLLAHPPAFGGIARGVVTFLVGRRVFEVSPPLLARALCPSLTELKDLAQSAARIATNQTEPGDRPLADRLDRQGLLRITAAVNDAMARTGRLDVRRWSQCADVSAARAGLLLSGDLDAARASLAFEAQSPTDLSPRNKMKELVRWFLGDTCAAMRRAIGVSASPR